MSFCVGTANKPIITIKKGDTVVALDKVNSYDGVNAMYSGADTIYVDNVDTVYHKANTPYVDQGATAMVMLIDGTVDEDVPVTTVKNTVPLPGQWFVCACAA